MRSGWLFPGEYRRTREFGMWLTNVDGTRIWRYAGIKGHARVREAYREGYDGSRYIATLIAAGGEDWLEAIPQQRITQGNLDGLRREVAEEILRL